MVPFLMLCGILAWNGCGDFEWPVAVLFMLFGSVVFADHLMGLVHVFLEGFDADQCSALEFSVRKWAFRVATGAVMAWGVMHPGLARFISFLRACSIGQPLADLFPTVRVILLWGLLCFLIQETGKMASWLLRRYHRPKRPKSDARVTISNIW
jgi:hypothetical protein